MTEKINKRRNSGEQMFNDDCSKSEWERPDKCLYFNKEFRICDHTWLGMITI